ncbi:Bacteriophytochrome cph2 [Gammaproteobacteria bacterium MOLA455]|nr:Bacteriophytochrome cph2 [Gammaproteobacteria bacterium MOLA455]
MPRLKPNWFDTLRFKTQISLVFILGILVLAFVTSLTVSKISSSIIEVHEVLQGKQVTESLARRSEIALLYQSPEAASDIGEDAMNFPGVKGILIETDKSDVLFSMGSMFVADSSDFVDQDTQQAAEMASEKATELSLISENIDFWKFASPVYTSSADDHQALDTASSDHVLLGYITVVVGKDTLHKMQKSILQNNLIGSFVGAIILLSALLYFSRRLTTPIERLSTVMKRAQQGEEKIRAEIQGPVDITDMQKSFNRMMQVLENRRRELKRAMKMAMTSAEMKVEFAANVTHELRTPMNAVLGMLDLLTTMGLSLKQQEYVQTAKSSGDNLLALIDDILNFSEADAGKISITNRDYMLHESLDEVVGLLSSTALKKHLNIGYIIDDDVPLALHSDSDRIRQVLINLAGNALKFTERGDVSIHISLHDDEKMASGASGQVPQERKDAGSTVRLRFIVKDTGIGIAPEDQARIFEAFTQVDSSNTKGYQGTGLGLAISSQIVELMGGDIFVSSELGKGSQFGFSLPVMVAQPLEPEAAEAGPADGSVAKTKSGLEEISALFVSASEILNGFAAQQFKALGVRAKFAASGLKALDIIRQSQARDCVDILFVDQDLDDIKINELLKFIQLEPNFGKRPVVMLSNPWNKDSETSELTLPRLNKPLRSNSLVDILSKYFVAGSGTNFDDDRLPEEVAAPRSCKILVVDDSRANQQVACAMLERLGCQATLANNGKEALEKVVRKDYDLVFMDCNMPVMNGYDCTKQIRLYEGDQAGRLPIIAMTANNSENEERICREVGMSDFLSKPLSLAGLREKLTYWYGNNPVPDDEPDEEPVEKSVDVDAKEVKQPVAGYTELSYDVKVIASLREAVGEVVSSMIAAFLEDTPIYIGKLKIALTENNARQVRDMAHTIKGSAANFGAVELVAASKKLEDGATREDLSDGVQLLKRIYLAFDALQKDLKQEISLDAETAKVPLKSASSSNILVVDDDRTVRMALVDAFTRENYEVEEANNGMQALNICKRHMPDLVLMDAVMPELDGFDACQMIRELPHGSDIPVLMITALNDEQSIVRAFSSGATDYISKPINFSVIKQRVARLIKASKAEQDVKKLAYHDPLTSLPNRTYLKQQLAVTVNRAATENQRFAILFLDLDRFKMINDTMGHDAGDLLLKAVADRIRHCVRENDFVARLGGDEFTVVLENIASLDGASSVAEKICRSVARPFVFMQQKMFVTTSIGISIFPDDGEDVSALIKHADSAMFRAKEKRDDFCFYERGMEAEIAKRLKLEQELRKAIDGDQLVLHYQPQIDFKTGDLVGAEALVRWEHPLKGLVPPDVFIPLAEESGLINQLTDWVLENSALQIKRWLDEGYRLTLAVNLSVKDLMQEDLHTKLQNLIKRSNLPPNVLELEITESTLMDHPELMIKELNKIKKMGITVAMDDFGSGYSSLNYLKKLPVDVLKIDRSFISDIESDSSDSAIVAGIIALAKNLGMSTVAEGVETEAQRCILQQLGCDSFQGYLVSKPVTPQRFAELFLSAEKVI